MTGELAAAERQLDWLAAASARLPVAESELRQHFSDVLLTAVGGPAGFNGALAGIGPLKVHRILAAQSDRVRAEVGGATEYILDLHVNSDGLLDDFQAAPNDPVPASWDELDVRLAGLGGRVSFAATEIVDRGCRLVHGVAEDVARPMGSAFKLYVLGALGTAVSQHRASWGERLSIRDDWKSLPSGVLQDDPAGTELTLAQYADRMISISDNTATDHLIHRLGRAAVERQLVLFGNRAPAANLPLLTTKALFELKATSDPARADAFLALPDQDRPAAVADLERLPLDGLAGWERPRNIDEIEWFGSAADVCRAFAGLWHQNQPEIGHTLSINDDGLGLDRSLFPAVWYKGGSEPGVLTMNYLARTAGGRTLATSVMVSDPAAPLAKDHVVGECVAIVRGAFQLMAAQPR